VVAAAGGGSAFAVLSGPGIRRGAILERVVRVNDLAPTVAHLVELPVPSGTDGAVLYQAFHDPNVKTKQVRALRDGLARVEKALAEESWQPWHGTGEPAF
jgi:arylsulfatase A-like enzyme